MKSDVPKSVLEDLFCYNPDTGHFRWLNSSGRVASGQRAGSLRTTGYRVLRFWWKGKRVHLYEHRAAWIMMRGKIPDREIDHINRDRADNRIANLRLASRADNNRNRGPIRGAKYKGVSFDAHSGKWRAYICVNKKRTWLGRYATAEEALAVYQRKARELHGAFACWL